MSKHHPFTSLREIELTSLDVGDAEILISRIETPKGARLELVRSDDVDQSRRLDAVALECLTWQDQERFDRLDEEYRSDAGDEPLQVVTSTIVGSDDIIEFADDRSAPIRERDELTNITNEFAHATVSAVKTDQYDLLEIAAPKLNLSIFFNGPALDCIIHLPMDVFDQLIRDEIE